MNHAHALHNYLRQMVSMRQTMQPKPKGINFWCMEDFVLDHGVAHTSAPLTEDELAILLDAIDMASIRFKYKQCYYNAQLMTLYDPTQTLRYNEGYAQGRSIPCLHAWLTLNGKVIDLTWRTAKPNHKGRLRDRVFGVIPEHWQYIGVEFAVADIRRRMVDTGMAASFIDDWEGGYPVLQQERRTPCAVKPLGIPPEFLGKFFGMGPA